MKLKKLKIKNIRTYVDQEVSFPDGIIFFEGDIGSGKSTILTAIEFGLFGLGNLEGGDVLRQGETTGSVELTFEAYGEEYTVYRMLKRDSNGKIKQDNSFLETPESKLPLGTTDLKQKILEVLKFRESSNPRAHSVIFRYAIYTPQEEMKSILFQEPAGRLETLRKAFNVEDYRIAKNNSLELSRELKQQVKLLNEKIKEEELVKKHIETITTENLNLQKQKTEFESKYVQTEDEEKKVRIEIEKMESLKNNVSAKNISLMEQKKQMDNTKKEIEELEVQNRDCLEHIKNYKGKIDSLSVNCDRINHTLKSEQVKFNQLKLEPKPQETEPELKLKLNHVASSIEKINKNSGGIEKEISNFKSLISNKVCPTCEQNISPDDFQSRLVSKQEEHKILEQKNQELISEKKEIEQLIEKINFFKSVEHQIKICETRIYSEKSLLESNQKQIKEFETLICSLEKTISENKNKLKLKQENLAKFSEIEKIIKSSEDELSKIVASIKILNQEINLFSSQQKEVYGTMMSIGSRLTSNKERVAELESGLQEIIKAKLQKDHLEFFNQWLQEYFSNAMDVIEQHVLNSINERFSILFKKWFNSLLDNTDINVEIDSAFTPLVRQGDWEQTINSLSGGEKTAVALAYRLALNSIIREISLKDFNSILILDEPTDGFSKEQYAKVQEVLKTLESSQIILVSHETELESCADHVYRIEKKGRISTLEKK